MVTKLAHLSLRNYVNSLGFGMVVAIATILTTPSESKAQVVCSAQQVLNLEVIQGQRQWVQTATQRVAGATWQFNDNGTFIYSPAQSRTDLYPVQGNFQRQGRVIQFSGSRYSSTSVSRAGVELAGQVDFNQNPPVLTMNWASANNVAAIVNNTLFASRTAAIYSTRVLLSC